MNNFHPSSHSNVSSGNSNSNTSSSFGNRRQIRDSENTGALPALGTLRNYPSSGSFDFQGMLESLHELFEHDRQVASQPDSTRCGICYLHFTTTELYYREEGFYVCSGCEQALSKQRIQMIRQQQK
ncbi:MAG: hypothetical protein M3Z24_06905 [Chloroflexota bacterium]|nr:hypothetical protein [Chloroflexota bacterium]